MFRQQTKYTTTTIPPMACGCGGKAFLMRRTLHPDLFKAAELRTFACGTCAKQIEISVDD